MIPSPGADLSPIGSFIISSAKMNAPWEKLALPLGLLGFGVTLHLLAARTFAQAPLSWDGPGLYGASAFTCAGLLTYLLLRRKHLTHHGFFVIGTGALILLGFSVFRALHILVVEWGSV
jgi:hypothetical protein